MDCLIAPEKFDTPLTRTARLYRHAEVVSIIRMIHDLPHPGPSVFPHPASGHLLPSDSPRWRWRSGWGGTERESRLRRLTRKPATGFAGRLSAKPETREGVLLPVRLRLWLRRDRVEAQRRRREKARMRASVTTNFILILFEACGNAKKLPSFLCAFIRLHPPSSDFGATCLISAGQV